MSEVMETKIELNEEKEVKETVAAPATAPAVPAAPATPAKPKLFSKGSKSRKVAKGIGIGILGTTLLGILGKIIFKAGEASGERKAEQERICDAEYVDVTPVESVPFESEPTNESSSF